MVFQNLDTYLQIRIFQAENITWDDLKTSFGVLNAEKMVMIEIETEKQSDDNFPLWPEKPVSFSGYTLTYRIIVPAQLFDLCTLYGSSSHTFNN